MDEGKWMRWRKLHYGGFSGGPELFNFMLWWIKTEKITLPQLMSFKIPQLLKEWLTVAISGKKTWNKVHNFVNDESAYGIAKYLKALFYLHQWIQVLQEQIL